MQITTKPYKTNNMIINKYRRKKVYQMENVFKSDKLSKYGHIYINNVKQRKRKKITVFRRDI